MASDLAIQLPDRPPQADLQARTSVEKQCVFLILIVDLKVGKFSYADAGQMHLYLNYAREHWMKPGENPPIGLILCAEKGAAEAHYALVVWMFRCQSFFETA